MSITTMVESAYVVFLTILDDFLLFLARDGSGSPELVLRFDYTKLLKRELELVSAILESFLSA